MHLVENQTKLKHRTFGIGTYKRRHSSSDAIIIEFSKGEKTIAMTAFDKGLISVVEEESLILHEVEREEDNSINSVGNMIQYEKSDIQIGGKNVLKAFSSDKSLLFNESYTIIGDKTTAESIRACYDLTVVGNLEAKKIEITGSLTVLGNIKAEEIYCNNDLLCQGDLIADFIEVGNDLIVKSIEKCKKLCCGGSVIAQKTIDTQDTNIEKVVIAGEGIVGSGNFSSKSVVAVGYFEYEGEVEGKIYDLDMDTVYGKERTSIKDLSFEELISAIKKIIVNNIVEYGDEGEDSILNFVKSLKDIDISNLNDWHVIFEHVVEISYLNEIDNLKDYLILFYAKKILPKEMIEYESVEHIFKQPYEDAVVLAEDLPFFVNSIEELILSLNIVSKYGDEINIDQDKAYDKIFQSVGIKYNTVKSFIINK